MGRQGAGNAGKVAGLMGSAPGAVQNISANEVRKLRHEISSLRDKNDDLKEALHEARQEYLLAKQDRDTYRARF